MLKKSKWTEEEEKIVLAWVIIPNNINLGEKCFLC